MKILKKRIVLVDDDLAIDENFRNIFSTYFNEYQITYFENPENAKHYIKKNKSCQQFSMLAYMIDGAKHEKEIKSCLFPRMPSLPWKGREGSKEIIYFNSLMSIGSSFSHNLANNIFGEVNYLEERKWVC